MQSKKQQFEKEKKNLYHKDIVKQNPIFSKEHIDQFYDMFILYADNTRKCDIADILNTARTLGFDKKYSIVYSAINEIASELNGLWVDFETYLTLLTNKLGNPFSKDGRQAMFHLIDPQSKGSLNCSDLQKISQHFHYNLSDEDIQEIINNVAGFGKSEITWEQFNKYIQRKIEKKSDH